MSPKDGFVNPFQLQRPSSDKQSCSPLSDDDDVVEIPKPINVSTWTNNVAHPATYSSLVKSIGGFIPNAKTKGGGKSGGFVDLTDTALFEDKFGDEDPYAYVDVAQATENIKALLEGAFEDEGDKPKTRSKKKKTEVNATNLVDKLEGLNVTATDDQSGDSQKGMEAVEEEEEEEVDDGTIEGLKVKLLPHQVHGVDWMREREASTKKKNGVLPKGGILADDV